MKNRYRSKVVEIDAFRFQREPYPAWFEQAVRVGKIVVGVAPEMPTPTAVPPPEVIITRPAVFIQTLEGRMMAVSGDWIIRGTEGELYPCKDSVFQRKYEAVT